MKKILSIVLTLCLTSALGINLIRQHIPRPAPDISVLDLQGQSITLKALRGGPLLLSFWSTSCRICLQEMPGLIALYEELGPLGLNILAVAMSYDPPSQVVELSRAAGIPYPVILDLDGRIAEAFDRVAGTPTQVLINAAGEIILQHTGKTDMAELKQQIMAHLPYPSDAQPTASLVARNSNILQPTNNGNIDHAVALD